MVLDFTNNHNILSMKIKRQHPVTGQLNEMALPITESQWEQYKRGGLAQVCFPTLTSDEREFIISGTLPGEWDELFPDE